MDIVDSNLCCGCRSCVQVCPVNAVKVKNDKYGFERITIDTEKCIECNKCKKVCPILNNHKIVEKNYECGSAFSNDEKTRYYGSSGGLFGAFARFVIQHGGVVYGAAFDGELYLKTTRVDSLKHLRSLYKSKYLLCDTTNSFSMIKKDLDSGLLVLYCSSPCQLAGLKNFLNKEYDNLINVEFVCHGVGREEQFNKSVKYIEKKKKIKILNFAFREKFKAASSHYYYYYYQDCKTGKKKYFRDIYMTFPYYYAYSDRITCRESCYNCTFASKERVGDITIGDFHTINKYEPQIDRFKGVSMYLCNSKKGFDFFNSIRDSFTINLYDINTIYNNNRFEGKEIPSKKRQEYLESYVNDSYDIVVKKYFCYLY